MHSACYSVLLREFLLYFFEVGWRVHQSLCCFGTSLDFFPPCYKVIFFFSERIQMYM